MQCSAVRCCAVQCDVVQCSAMLCSAAQWVQCSGVQYTAVGGGGVGGGVVVVWTRYGILTFRAAAVLPLGHSHDCLTMQMHGAWHLMEKP